MQRYCPICKSEKFTLVFHDHNRREGFQELESDYVKCIECGMLYLTNIPDLESMAEKYSEIYVHPNITDLRNQLKNTTKRLDQKILDIGCNHGIQLIPYYNKGWEVY